MKKLLNELKAPDLCKYAQVIPEEMMLLLRASAEEKGVGLDIEIALRLLATMAMPEVFETNPLFIYILQQKPTVARGVAESKSNRHQWQYLYEVEKLRLFLRLEHNLPRNIKETFTLIDVKEVTKQIKAELATEERALKGE